MGTRRDWPNLVVGPSFPRPRSRRWPSCTGALVVLAGLVLGGPIFVEAQGSRGALLQLRVDDSCPPGEAIREIGADGSVTCQAVGGAVAAVENVIVVAKSGGDFTSVAAALDSIVGASASNRFLVHVMPGVYTEANLSVVGAYIHLKGSGPNVTVIESARSSNGPGVDGTTVELDDLGRISEMTVRNTGVGIFGIALYSAEATRETVVAHAVLEAVGAGGTGHYAAYLNDSEPTIEYSLLRATGAVGFGSAVNAALGIVNIAGGFPQPLVVDSTLIGGADNGITCVDNTGTGFGIQGTNASPEVRNSFICGGYRAVFLGINGFARIHGSRILAGSNAGAFLFETGSSATVLVAASEVQFFGNKHTGTGGLVCVHSYKSNFLPADDGNTSGTACE